MRVLICGAGVAGPTLACWLDHYGFETTIIEEALGYRPRDELVTSCTPMSASRSNALLCVMTGPVHVHIRTPKSDANRSRTYNAP